MHTYIQNKTYIHTYIHTYTHTYKTKKQKDKRKLLEVMAVVITFIVMVSQVFAYVQTHQIIYVKYMPFSCGLIMPQ